MIHDVKNIYIEKGDTVTTLRPKNQQQAMITQTLSDIQDKGLPTNDELDAFGEKLWEMLEKSKIGSDKEVKKIVEQTQEVVSNIQTAVKEKNYDGVIQDIVRKLSENVNVNTTDVNMKEDAEKIGNTLKNCLQMIFDVSKSMINDPEFRDMLVTILDIVQSSYERAEFKTPSISESIKSDIKNPKSSGQNTSNAIRKRAKVLKSYMDLDEQERNEILNKASAALLRFKRHPEYEPLMRSMFQLYDEFVEAWSKVEQKPFLKTTYEDRASVLNDIKKLLERASGRSLNTWVNNFKELEKIKSNPKYIAARKDIETLLFDPNQKYQNENDIKELYEKIKKELKALNDDYNNVFDRITQETKLLLNSIGSDPTISKLGNSLNKLVTEVFTDESGKPTIEATTSSLAKIKDVFFPIIKQQFAYLMFPNIDIETNNYFLRIENFNLHLDHIIPDQIQIQSDSKINIDLDKMKRSGEFNFYLNLDNITTKIENLRFQLKKKTGLIKYNDSGLVHIYLDDSAIKFSFRINLEEDIVDSIEVTKVDVDLSNMKIKILESDHEWIDSIIATVFLPYLRSRLTSTLEGALYDLLNNGVCEMINYGLKKIEEPDYQPLK